MTGRFERFRAEPKPLVDVLAPGWDEDRVIVTKEELMPPFRPAGYVGTILAVDQSLAHTGWYLFAVDAQCAELRDCGVILTTMTSAKGHEGNLQRAEVLAYHFRELVKKHRPDRLAHELPPLGSGAYSRNNRPDSSLIAATTIRVVWTHETRSAVKSINAQQVKKRWTGNAKATKQQLQESLVRLVPGHLGLRINNEHTRDALALGLLAAEGWTW